MRISDWSSDVCSSDLLGDVAAVADRRQVVAQELAAAMDMRQREFGTVGGGIAASANVSGVMKQRDQHAEHTAMRAESLRSRHAALMSVDQAPHRPPTVQAGLGFVVPVFPARIAGPGPRL